VYGAELVPHFEQSDAAYIGYPGITDAYERFDLELSFKPETTDGLSLSSVHVYCVITFHCTYVVWLSSEIYLESCPQELYDIHSFIHHHFL